MRKHVARIVALSVAAFSAPVFGQQLVANDGEGGGKPGVVAATQSQSQAPVNVYVMGGSNPSGVQAAASPQPGNGNGLSPLPDLPKTAYETAKGMALPVSTQESRDFRRDLDDQKRVLGEPVRARKPAIRDQVIDISPGATPPLVRPSKNYGSLVTFLDETGAPWPIAGADGMSDDFTIRWASGTSNAKRTALQVVPKASYGSGNISVVLQGMDTPLIVSVEIGYSKEVDYRVDYRIPGRGPLALADPAPVPMPAQLPRYVGDILQGIPPTFAKLLKMQGGEGQAYRVEDKLVIRTPMILLSPVPVGRLPSADGTYAYLLEYTPVVLASKDGIQRQITISE